MSPRPYDLGKRREQVDQGRRQVLDAARALLGDAGGYTAFTVDAVARRADVARGTVYYQFGSKTGLLEALCDDLAATGGLADLPRAFATPGAEEALAAFLACFARFWQADRTVMRRLRALAALDPEVQAVIAARDQRRRDGLEALLRRLLPGASAPTGARRARMVRMLLAVSSFETFDALAAPGQDLTAVVPQVVQLARAARGVPDRLGPPGADAPAPRPPSR